MNSSNPVLSHIDRVAEDERRSEYPSMQAPPGYAQPAQPAQPAPPATRPMTVDDVVVRTIGLLLLTGAVAAIAWVTLGGGPVVGLALIGSALAGLVLVLVITFRRITNPFVIGAYAVVQGVLLGVVSRSFEQVYPGIVVQAVVGTFGVFAGMAVLYKFRVLRATPRFTRFVVGALIGVVVLSLANWVVYLITGRQGLEVYSTTGEVGWLPYVFALVCIGVGALTFILDFDAVEKGVRYGLPQRYAWYCAFGLLVGLIYLYWQILRLLSYIRR